MHGLTQVKLRVCVTQAPAKRRPGCVWWPSPLASGQKWLSWKQFEAQSQEEHRMMQRGCVYATSLAPMQENQLSTS